MPPAKPPPALFSTLSVQQLSEKLNLKPPANSLYVLDVREPNEWAHCHIDHPAVHHLPMGQLEDVLATQPSVIPHNSTIAVLCKVGGRSAKVAAFLTMLGFNAANVTGGMQAWVAEIDPTLPTP